jgi:hypothetical protein
VNFRQNKTVRLALRDRESDKNSNGKRYGIVDKFGAPTVLKSKFSTFYRDDRNLFTVKCFFTFLIIKLCPFKLAYHMSLYFSVNLAKFMVTNPDSLKN